MQYCRTKNFSKVHYHQNIASSLSIFQAKSTLGKNLTRILGNTAEVQNLDKWRVRMKTSRSAEGREEYEVALALVQTKVLREHGCLKRKMKLWETDYFKVNGKEPWGDDLKAYPDIHTTYKHLKLAEQFLKHWGITVHL